MIRALLGALQPRTPVLWRAASRSFAHHGPARNSWFGDLTKSNAPAPVKPEGTDGSDTAAGPLPKDDTELQEYYMKEARAKQILREKYVSPLKQRLFDANVAANGFFKNNQVVVDPDTKTRYRVSLTEAEIEMLEPSLYIQSARLKLSMKKATVVNRFVRKFTVKHAISQLHFNPKKMATELEKLLKTGLDQARTLGYNEDRLYIHALWTGSDGNWVKRPDIKGRGRTGIITHRYVHLKAVLKTEQTVLRREWERQQRELAAKPRMHLNNEPLNFKVRGHYKW